MGNDLGRNKLSTVQLRLLKKWINGLLGTEEEPGYSQHALAPLLGVSQSLISDIRRNIKQPSLGTLKRMLAFAKKNRLPIEAELSSDPGTAYAAGPYERSDRMQARGRALDILGAEYDDDFCDAVAAGKPPKGSPSWTVEEWIEYIVDLRKMWKAGPKSPPSRRNPSDLAPGNTLGS